MAGIAEADADAVAVCAANVDRRRCSSVPWHDGHAGTSWPLTSTSNCVSQAVHAYSNSGMTLFYAAAAALNTAPSAAAQTGSNCRPLHRAISSTAIDGGRAGRWVCGWVIES